MLLGQSWLGQLDLVVGRQACLEWTWSNPHVSAFQACAKPCTAVFHSHLATFDSSHFKVRPFPGHWLSCLPGIWSEPQSLGHGGSARIRQHKSPDQPTLGALTANPHAAQGTLDDRLAQPLHDREPTHLPIPGFTVPATHVLQQPPEECIVPFVSYAPRYQPEVFRLRLHLPCGPVEALARAEIARADRRPLKFPTLCYVEPQLTEAYVTVLAVPPWLTHQVIVLFDCRPFNGVVFSEVVAPRLRREDLLVIAGLGSGACVHVYFGTAEEPLPPLAFVQPALGDVITIAYYGTPRPPSHSIVNMLQSPQGWHDIVTLPGHQDSAL